MQIQWIEGVLFLFRARDAIEESFTANLSRNKNQVKVV